MRGRAYCNDGNVRALRVNDDSVTGVVVGGMPYQVRLSTDDGELSSECTCPVGHTFCKHAVALGLGTGVYVAMIFLHPILIGVRIIG